MSKADLSNVLSKAGGGTRGKQIPAAPEAPAPKKAPPAANTRAGMSPITVHYPPAVRDQLKIIAIEERRTMQSLIGEAYNDLFAKYGKPEIAPVD